MLTTFKGTTTTHKGANVSSTAKSPTTITTTPDTTTWTKHGRNVRTQLLDGMLFIAVQTAKEAYANINPTAKGNVTIASTLGNVGIDGTNLKLGLNIYGPPPAA